ncbi:SGNH hydrolase, partial [Arthrobacter agilis]
QMWSSDRLHFSPLGHHTIAAMVLDTLAVRHTLEPLHPKELPARTWRAARAEDFVWAREYFVPWVLRRLRHRSSGDGVLAKRPDVAPIFGPGMPPGAAD